LLIIIIILIILGTLLIAAEVFLPGLVAGVMGACALFAAVVLGYWHYGFTTGTFMLLGISAAAMVGFIVWIYLFPRTFLGRRLLLKSEIKSPDDHPSFEGLINKEGTALTPLRPSGTAMIEGKRVDVIAENEMIGANERVRVVQVDGVRVIVRAA
jgi:membrane-bound serine protease (ClpP class)